jgi:heme/copper-type cytochrome/quinol oxidase subunit 4
MLEPLYIAVAIISLAVISILFFKVGKKKENRLSRLASISFAFVIAGIIFGDYRLVGYSLIGVGIVIAVVDMIKKS